MSEFWIGFWTGVYSLGALVTGIIVFFAFIFGGKTSLMQAIVNGIFGAIFWPICILFIRKL